MKVSVLDQSPVIFGSTAADAISATIDLAQACDDLGFHRYWCAEHHGLFGVANPAPEIMLASLGARTKRLRLGSAGVMLPYYSPFKVAEQFLMLEALYPGRIDLGVGRAPGGDQRAAQAVAAGQYSAADHFAEQVSTLAGLLHGDLPPGHIMEGVLLQPDVKTRPELWILGSSEYGGALAAHLSLKFAFAHFINPTLCAVVSNRYRERFSDSTNARPRLAIAMSVICADTNAEVEDLVCATDMRRVQMAQGANAPIPTIAQARRQIYSERDRVVIERERPRSLIGTTEHVIDQLRQKVAEYAADELVVLTVAPSYAARMRSYELLARAFGLSTRQPEYSAA